jgi:hypothetical protein
MRARLVNKRAHLVHLRTRSASSSQPNHSIVRATHVLVAFSLPPPLRREPARGEPSVRKRVELRLLSAAGSADTVRGVRGLVVRSSVTLFRYVCRIDLQPRVRPSP